MSTGVVALPMRQPNILRFVGAAPRERQDVIKAGLAALYWLLTYLAGAMVTAPNVLKEHPRRYDTEPCNSPRNILCRDLLGMARPPFRILALSYLWISTLVGRRLRQFIVAMGQVSTVALLGRFFRVSLADGALPRRVATRMRSAPGGAVATLTQALRPDKQFTGADGTDTLSRHDGSFTVVVSRRGMFQHRRGTSVSILSRTVRRSPDAA